MNMEEFERLKARFGEQILSWPAPYHQEAKLFLERAMCGASKDDGDLDRLVLEASLAPTDEQALSRKVVEQIARPTHAMFGLSSSSGLWSFPATAASLALVLALAAVGGYVSASMDGDLSGNVLLALATGEAPAGLIDIARVPDSDGGRR